MSNAASHPLVIVAAVAENGVIGFRNRLPWRLKTDLKRFRALTMGKPVIMGRRSYDSIGHPLPGRAMVVMTRDPTFWAEGVEVATSWDDAKRMSDAAANRLGSDEVAVVGGAEIYRLALPEASRLLLTLVHARPEGDVLFPNLTGYAFRKVASAECPPGPDDEYAATFLDLEPSPRGTARRGRGQWDCPTGLCRERAASFLGLEPAPRVA